MAPWQRSLMMAPSLWLAGGYGELDVSSDVDPSSSGVFQLTGRGELEIAAVLGTNLKIQFLGGTPTNELVIDSAASFGKQVGSSSYAGPLLEGFTTGDEIYLKDIAPAGLSSPPTYSGGDLQFVSGSKAVATLAFQNSSVGAGTFHTEVFGNGDVLLTHS
jgi:hypothetical protein